MRPFYKNCLLLLKQAKKYSHLPNEIITDEDKYDLKLWYTKLDHDEFGWFSYGEIDKSKPIEDQAYIRMCPEAIQSYIEGFPRAGGLLSI